MRHKDEEDEHDRHDEADPECVKGFVHIVDVPRTVRTVPWVDASLDNVVTSLRSWKGPLLSASRRRRRPAGADSDRLPLEC